MEKLRRDDLYTLEDYAIRRPEFRSQVMAHKAPRRIRVGEHVTFYFEDRLTMHYQIQEMLRAERIFESDAIQEELDTYNALIPEGGNWKVTFMIEYEDAAERREALARLIGIERKAWVGVDGFERVYAIADEDLERETEEKTSSVHFLRFELDSAMIAAAKAGADVAVGIEHEAYSASVSPLPEPSRQSLAADLG
jgi:hypothetical protein